MKNRYKLISLIITLILPFFISTKVFASSINLQSDITEIANQENEYTVNLTLSINVPNNTDGYLRGVFYKPNTSNYCGYTWNDKDWFNGPYTTNDGWKNLLKITINNSSWSGTLKAKIDPNETACSNSGEYNFKIIRYTASGSQSNDNQTPLAINFIAPPIPTTKPTNTPTPTPTPKTTTPTKTPTPIKTSTTTSTTNLKDTSSPTQKKPTKTPSKTPSKSLTKKITVSPAKRSSRSATPKITPKKDILGANTKSEKTSSPSPIIFITIASVLFIICAILIALKIKWKKQ